MLLALLGIIRLFSFSTGITSNDELYRSRFKSDYRIFAVNIPHDANFAGEQVPLHDFEVRERLDREFLVNTYWQSQTILLAKRANRWFKTIEPILEKNGIPEDFKYLAVVESGFTNAVSSKGAAGFWQFIPATAKEYGLTVNDEIDDRYHVEKATEAACKYFRDAYKLFGNWTTVAASYNMGLTGIQKQLSRQKASNYYDLVLNDETARYVFRVIAIKEILKNPSEYGFVLRKKDLYPRLPFTVIHVDSTIKDLADFATQHNINYKLLKYFNPWLRTEKLTNREKKQYALKVPSPEVLNYDDLLKMMGEEMNEPVDSTTLDN